MSEYLKTSPKGDEFKKPETFVCGENSKSGDFEFAIGCCGRFPEPQFFKAAGLCRDCAADLASEYGVAFADADFVRVAKGNEPFYTGRTKGFEKYTDRMRIRILLLSVGVQVKFPTDEERKAGARLREIYPESIGKIWMVAEQIVESVAESFDRNLVQVPA